VARNLATTEKCQAGHSSIIFSLHPKDIGNSPVAHAKVIEQPQLAEMIIANMKSE